MLVAELLRACPPDFDLVKQSAIRELYTKQLELRALLKLKTLRKESVARRIPEWLSMTAELKACPLEAMFNDSGIKRLSLRSHDDALQHSGVVVGGDHPHVVLYSKQ